MKEFFPSALLVGVVAVLPVAAESAPLPPIKYAGPELTIPVADGCGINRYRDSRGICRRKYEFTRHRGKPQLYGSCGGVDSHRVCNLYVQCCMVCDCEACSTWKSTRHACEVPTRFPFAFARMNGEGHAAVVLRP